MTAAIANSPMPSMRSGLGLTNSVLVDAFRLPDRAWASARLGRRLLTGLGILFAGMAVLQATGTWLPWCEQLRPAKLAGRLASMSATGILAADRAGAVR